MGGAGDCLGNDSVKKLLVSVPFLCPLGKSLLGLPVISCCWVLNLHSPLNLSHHHSPIWEMKVFSDWCHTEGVLITHHLDIVTSFRTKLKYFSGEKHNPSHSRLPHDSLLNTNSQCEVAKNRRKKSIVIASTNRRNLPRDLPPWHRYTH